MRFVTLVGKNLLRRRTRSLLTVAGVAIGIGAVVALTSIAWGFERSWARAYDARGTDLAVLKIASQSPLPAVFDEGMRAELAALPGVASATGLLNDFMGIEDSPGMIVFGWELESYLWDHLRLVEGRWPRPGERAVVLGSVAADLLGKSAGSSVQLDVREYAVSGIYESPALVENGALVLALPEMQSLGGNAGKLNFVNLKLDPSQGEAGRERLKREIKERFPGFRAFNSSEVAQSNTGVQLARAMSWATSLLALVVGAVGVMNTVFMSVFERFREIGVLLAIGWRPGRIMRMILLESVVLSLAGGVAGVVLGFLAVQLVEVTPMMRGRIEGEISLRLALVGLAVALALGLIGGLYPAWRGSRLPPSAALRYE